VRVDGKRGELVRVADIDELKADQMKLVELNGRRIVLARSGDDYIAFDDRCTHRGASLAGGMMMCGTVQCPWHGSQFDVRTGECRAGPADRGIATYAVEVSGRQVQVRVPENTS
jgi:nitrite reductase/ring-hydroxylating ferredoxin subunit